MREDDERLRQAIRVGNIGIFEHDHATGVIYWSLELRQMYGWDADEPATLPKILSHVYPEDAERVIAAVRRAHDPAGDGLFDIEHRILDRGGVVRWVATRSQTHFTTAAGVKRAVRTIGAVQDVTDRCNADERLRILDTVLSSSAQAIAIADASGTMTFANAALRRLWGYPDTEELVGRSLADLGDIQDGEPGALFDHLREDRMWKLEVPANRVDGTSFYLGIAAEAVCDASGSPTQILMRFTDVTDRKRLEAQLFQAQKMESVGRLAGGVAHDFNNLLTVMWSGLELAMAELPSEHSSRGFLGDVMEAAQSAAALTRQLLAFSRKEIIAPRVLDLREVIRRMEKMVLRLVGEDIQLTTSCAPDLTSICFDPGQVEQIVLNLAINARDAMPDGGRLTIQASNVTLDEAYAAQHVETRPGAYVLLAVSDSGAGMTENVRAHLFEPFFTTKGPGQGTGLGLAMVYGAVRQNGGAIEVTSEPSRGTTFKVYLPAGTGVPQPASTPVPIARRERSARVLLVEDDQRVRVLAKTVLVSLGYQVRAYANAADALEAAASLRATPELLVTDVVMPGMNGRILAERMRGLFPSLRVLYVSGYAQDVIVRQGVLNEGIEFLAKPYTLDQLARRVREVLDGPAATPERPKGR
ncbi:MAG: ATP-binding protein [Polyangia bacterium]